MIAPRLRHRLAAAAAVWITASAALLAQQQNPLSRAKDLYANASYDEALTALGPLPTTTDPVGSTETAAYQVFCLLALGRVDDAKLTVEAIVRTDFLYHPTDGMASPKVRAFFEDTRKPMLPAMAKAGYAKAKSHFDQKEMEQAVEHFDRLLSLLDEMEELGQSQDDLKTLTSGFRDLAKAAVAPPPPPKPVEPPPAPVEPTPAPVAAPVEPQIYGIEDQSVVKPVPLARPIPDWKPENPIDAMREYRGVLEIIIDEKGHVANASMVASIHPVYDPMLIRAAKGWKFKAAMKDGKAVKFRSRLEIHLSASKEAGKTN